MIRVKFRAWDKKEKRMFVVKSINIFVDCPANRGIKYSVYEKGYVCDNKTELMQFIGHKDKNGKEIYIGDILSWDEKCIIIILNKDELGFYHDVIDQKDKNIIDFDIRMYRSEECAEIIGNRYENRKLIPKGWIE